MADVDIENEETFIDDPPEDLRCPICLHVLTDPCQTSCGHRFCRECIEAVKKTSNAICPIDRIAIEGGVFQDNAAKMQIRRLKIHCPYKVKGCEWTGDLSDKSTHLRNCIYSVRACTQCGLILQVSQMDSHKLVCEKRIVSCEYCSHNMAYNSLEEHYGTCPMYPVPCPNKCQLQSLPRHSVDIHCFSECPRQPIACHLEAFGCTDKIPREDIDQHLVSCAQNKLASLAMLVLKQSKEINDLKSQLREQQNTVNSLQQTCYPCQPQFTWKITDIRDKIKSLVQTDVHNIQPLYSPAFFTSEGGYKLRLSIYPAGDKNQRHLSLYFVVMKGPFDDVLPWPFTKRICLFLINCKGGHNVVKDIFPDPRLHYFRKPTDTQNVGYGYPRFIPLGVILNEESEFVSNGSIFIRILVG